MNIDNIKLVQNNLWRNRHKVKRVPAEVGYDLIVDGKYKVKVYDFKANLKIDMMDIDVAAIIEKNMAGTTKVFYLKKGKTPKNKFKEAI